VALEFRNGLPHSLITVARDITERKQAEAKINRLLAEKELILKEVHHRIKNNMNTVAALLSMQASSSSNSEVQTALAEAENRLRSMSILYDKLYRSENFQAMSIQEYVPTLVNELISNFPGLEDIPPQYALEDIIFDAKKLSVLGMIINELVTNIMKYAFSSGLKREPLIKVSIHTNEAGCIELLIADNGKGGLDIQQTEGFGLQLIKALVAQLEGTLKVKSPLGQGTEIFIEFKGE